MLLIVSMGMRNCLGTTQKLLTPLNPLTFIYLMLFNKRIMLCMHAFGTDSNIGHYMCKSGSITEY